MLEEGLKCSPKSMCRYDLSWATSFYFVKHPHFLYHYHWIETRRDCLFIFRWWRYLKSFYPYPNELCQKKKKKKEKFSVIVVNWHDTSLHFTVGILENWKEWIVYLNHRSQCMCVYLFLFPVLLFCSQLFGTIFPSFTRFFFFFFLVTCVSCILCSWLMVK